MISGLIIFVLVAVIRIDAQSDCTGLPDGPYGAGCQSYTLCTDGEGVTIDCNPPEYVYNEVIGGCDLVGNTPPPCGNNYDCSSLPDGKYPVMSPPGDECEAFFTCAFGEHRGVTPCNPPDSTDELVFSYQMQLCTWRHQVQPPCGTYGVSPPPVGLF